MPSTAMQRADAAVLHMNAAMSDLLSAISELDHPSVWQPQGCRSLTDFVSSRYGLAWGSARELVRVARALRHLPALRQAFAAGCLSWDQLRPLTLFATPETDEQLARCGPDRSVAQLYREANRHKRIEKREAQDTQVFRSARMCWDEDRRYLHLEAAFPAEQGHAVERALTSEAEGIEINDEPVDREGARLHDALFARIAGGDESTRHLVVVHVDAETLAVGEPESGPVLAETESGGRLASETVRRIACDSKIEWVMEREGRPVGVGRQGRVLPPPIARVLRHRDGGVCGFHGCHARRWLHAHHLQHWARGGGTDLDNLVLLCSFHHRLLHEGGWTARGHPSEGIHFFDPNGRQVRRFAPEQPRGTAVGETA